MIAPTPRKIKKYGWKPDPPDFRDKIYQPFQKLNTFQLPPLVDLRPGAISPVFDQGNLGSCTGNGISAAIAYELSKMQVHFIPSRLFIYYNERVIEGSVSEDSGANIRDGIKSVASTGVCSEVDWPYNISKFATKPSIVAYSDAKKDIVKSYQSISQDVILNSFKQSLAAKNPVVLGFSVYDSFEGDLVALSGNVPYPQQTENMIGGHCVLAMGYNTGPAVPIIGSITKKSFIFPSQSILCQNSWGPDWGIDGFFTIPINYLSNPDLASDFWNITLVN